MTNMGSCNDSSDSSSRGNTQSRMTVIIGSVVEILCITMKCVASCNFAAHLLKLYTCNCLWIRNMDRRYTTGDNDYIGKRNAYFI